MQKLALTAFLMILSAASFVRAQVSAKPATGFGEFVRFVENPDHSARLEVADVAYRDSKGVTVHLVGAVHIADKEFFDSLNESFRHYDAVLYEMVRDKGAPPPVPGQKSQHWVGGVQRFMTTKLNLAYQLDVIDYRKKNMVHADMSPDEFEERQEARGESFFQIFLRSYEAQLERGPAAMPFGIMDLVNALQDPNGARDLKYLFGKAMANMDEQLAALEGPDGSVIIDERNEAAFKVLAKELKSGKRFLAVFYGAGHLTGMEEMITDMGFKRVDAVWRTAWKIGPPNVKATTQPAKSK